MSTFERHTHSVLNLHLISKQQFWLLILATLCLDLFKQNDSIHKLWLKVYLCLRSPYLAKGIDEY
jgi:hypothetical protein